MKTAGSQRDTRHSAVVRKALRFWLAPASYAHPDWLSDHSDNESKKRLLAGSLTYGSDGMADDADALARWLDERLCQPGMTGYDVCLDYRRIGCFTEAIDCVLRMAALHEGIALDGRPGHVALSPGAFLSEAQRQTLQDSARLLCANPLLFVGDAESDGQGVMALGQWVLTRAYAMLPVSIGERLRLLLPCDHPTDVVALSAFVPLPPGAERTLDRIWIMGCRQGYW